PGKHNIFDFLIPDPSTYQPRLSSVEIRPPRRMLRLGKWQFPLGKARVSLLRKSKPFWNVLSEHGVFNCILRVPITFPPEKLRGVQLSAMCVPDLRGTQGMFSHFTTRPPCPEEKTGGEVHHVARDGPALRGALPAPPHPLRPDRGHLTLPFTVRIKGPERAVLQIAGVNYELRLGDYTEWVPVSFRVIPGMKVHG